MENNTEIIDRSTTNEEGKPLISPEDIPIETAMNTINVLNKIFDDGDWWRLVDSVNDRYQNRRETHEFTEQDRNLAEKIGHLDEIREKKQQHNKLQSVFAGIDTTDRRTTATGYPETNAERNDEGRIEKSAVGPEQAYEYDQLQQEIDLLARDSIPKLAIETVQVERIEPVDDGMKRLVISGEKSEFYPTYDDETTSQQTEEEANE